MLKRTGAARPVISFTISEVKLTDQQRPAQAPGPGEVRLATWDEMDLDAAVWTIPAVRMKAKRDHRVPLSARAVAILTEARGRSDGTALVFCSPRGKPLSDMTLSKLIKELGIARRAAWVPVELSGLGGGADKHTSRSDRGPRSPIRYANPTEAAYARSDLFERRRRLMDDWATYLSGVRGHVVVDAGDHPSPSWVD